MAAFAALVGAGVVASAWNPALLRQPEATFWDGSWADAYQRAFDASSPLLGSSRTVWGVIDLALFGQGRPGVLVGKDGWLFSAEEYDVVRDFERAVDAWVGAIATVQERLAGHDATLVVVLVPAKAAIAGEHAPVPLPEGARVRYDAALAALRARGVLAPDLRKALVSAAERAPVFLRTDTHWTPHGAEAAARAVAGVLEHRATLPLGEARFDTRVVGNERVHGDLTAFLDLGPLLDRLGPPPDELELRHTVSVDGAGADLFAEVSIPVALVGTSYSADARWNLDGALRAALGVDVLQAARAGLGPLEPMERYLDSEAFRTTPPQVVVWEIPERYLTLDGHVPGMAPSESDPWGAP